MTNAQTYLQHGEDVDFALKRIAKQLEKSSTWRIWGEHRAFRPRSERNRLRRRASARRIGKRNVNV